MKSKRPNSMSSLLQRIFKEDPNALPHQVPIEKKRYDQVMLGLAIVSIALYGYEVREYGMVIKENSGYSGSNLFVASLAIDVLFLLDFLLKLVYTGRSAVRLFSLRQANRKYLGRWSGVLDMLATFPPLITEIIVHYNLWHGPLGDIGRVARLVKATRLLRVARSIGLLRESVRVARLLRQHHKLIRRELGVALLIIVSVMITGALGLRAIQELPELKKGVPHSPGEFFYWSIYAIMGQAESSELRDEWAKAVGIVVVFTGIVFFGIVSGSITSFIMNTVSKRTSGRLEYTGSDHIIVCGFSSKLEELLGYLRRMPDGRDIVLLFESESENAGEEFVGRHQNSITHHTVETTWVCANPRTTEGLRMANVARARDVIILADQSKGVSSEEDLDARSMMTLDMINKIYADMPVRRPVPHLTVELKTPQCVELARAKSAHVVYADDLICQYITLDASAHEASTIYSRLIDTHDQRIERLPIELAGVEVDGGKALDAIAARIQSLGGIFLGIRAPLSLIVEMIASEPRMYAVFRDDAALHDGLEAMWNAVLGTRLASTSGDGRAMPDHHLVNIRRGYAVDPEGFMQRFFPRVDGSDDRATQFLTILNPFDRRVLCAELLDTGMTSAFGHPRMHALAMRTTSRAAAGAASPLDLRAIVG